MTTTIESVEGLAELIASRPELAQFTDDQWALARALASVFQQPDPTADQCASFIDDAEACADSVGPGPYTVVKLGEATGNFNAVVTINGWLCAAEEGEGFIEVTPMSDLRAWTIVPNLAPQPVVDREAVREEIRAGLNSALCNGGHPDTGWSPSAEVDRTTDAVLALLNGTAK